MYRLFWKPFFDKLFAAIVLVLASPILLVAAALLYWQNKGSIWFIQERPGLNGKPFRILKFKTMTDQRDASGELLPDVLRTTRVGRYIRKFSIDELPQLLNVLIGHMSLVGPRPLLVEYWPLYSPAQRRRHEVKPGITGWAQVNGRNAIDWEQRFNLDVWYVDHQSFFLDLKILYRTVLKVLKASDVNKDSSVTMEKFKGNRG